MSQLNGKVPQKKEARKPKSTKKTNPRIAQLEAQVAELRESNEGLRSALSEKDTQIAQLQEALRHSEDGRQSDIDYLQRIRESEKQEATKRALDMLFNQVMPLERTVRALELQLALNEKLFAELYGEWDSLREKLGKKDRQVCVLADLLVEASNNYRVLVQENEWQREKIKLLEEMVHISKQLTVQYAELEKENESLKERIRLLEEITKISEALQEINSEIENYLKEEVERLRRDNVSTIERLTAQIETLQQKVYALTRQLARTAPRH